MRRYNWLLVLTLLLALGLPFISASPVLADSDTFYASNSSGEAVASNAVYATAHDAATSSVNEGVLSVGQVLGYNISRAFVYFDTSSVPDGATIDTVTLDLWGSLDLSFANFNLIVRSGMPTYPHDPLVAGDYLYSQYAGTGNDAWNTSSMVLNAYNTITLNATGRGWINKTGWTKLALISEEDVNSSAPTGFETIQFTGSSDVGASPEPRLNITYSASSSPSATTNDATNVTSETARLHAYLDNDGGESCELQFQYYTGEGAWADNQTGFEGDYYTGNSYYKDISGLDNTGTYYSSTSDGYIYVNDAVYSTAQSAAIGNVLWPDYNQIGQYLTANYRVARSFVFFNTSPLPDGAAIVEATLRLHGWQVTDADAWNVVIQEGMPTYPHDPLVGGDFNKTHYSSDGGSIVASSWVANDWNEITFNATGRGWINLTGDTKLTLRSSEDISATAPTGSDFVYFRSANYDSGSVAPELVVQTNMAVYTFRAQAQNSQGTASGSPKTFATINSVGDPSNLWGDPSYNSIALNWTKGVGANLSNLRYKEGGYPTDETDGTLAYNGIGSSYILTGLNAGETLYCRVWSQTGSTFSTNYSEVMVTTSAGSGAGSYDTPSAPGNWFLSPDPTNVSGLPGYDLVNNLADSYGVPQSVFWLALALFFILAFGLATYKVSDNLALSVMVVVVAIAIATSMRLIPGYMAGIFFIMATGIGFSMRRV